MSPFRLCREQAGTTKNRGTRPVPQSFCWGIGLDGDMGDSPRLYRLCVFMTSVISQPVLPHPRVDLLRRIRLHVRRHMGVDVPGDADVGVPETFLQDFPYSYLIASPGFMLVARRRGKKITISVPTITKTSDQPT